MKKIKCADIVLIRCVRGEVFLTDEFKEGIVINPTEEEFKRWFKEVQNRIDNKEDKNG